MVLLAIAALILGITYGAVGWHTFLIDLIVEHKEVILSLLMFSVGISIGIQKGILKKIREYHVKVLLIPLGIIIGSLVGGWICSFFMEYPPNVCMAAASGLGWYSLSSITVSTLAGAKMGSITFLSNLMREIFSFFSIPFISRHFNYYSCIAPAGATSEDTTLPMMMKYTDEETVVLSVLNGVICSIAVPILIPFCYHLNIG